MDQPRFFGAGNHACANARLVRDGTQELAAVFRFADGARRDRHDLFHAVRLGEPPELREHLERCLHRFRGERSTVEAPGAQPDHILFAINDLERHVGAHLNDDHVHGIRSDVDGGKFDHG